VDMPMSKERCPANADRDCAPQCMQASAAQA
jgi:hypothetical protein